jgi:hypothetical protein
MALIASRLHWVWIGTVCVRLENDTERLEKLFELYTKMTSQPAPPKKSNHRKNQP